MNLLYLLRHVYVSVIFTTYLKTQWPVKLVFTQKGITFTRILKYFYKICLAVLKSMLLLIVKQAISSCKNQLTSKCYIVYLFLHRTIYNPHPLLLKKSFNIQTSDF